MGSSDQTCYRHGDRRAGVICQRCDRPICPECMRQASVGFHCPHCSRSGSQQVYQGPRAMRPVRPYATMGIIVLVMAAYVVDQVWRVDLLFANGLVTEGFLTSEWKLYGPNVAAGDWWRPFTVGFVHAAPDSGGFGIMHVLFNMFLLYLLGQLLEPVLGPVRLVALYVVSLLGGSAAILAFAPEQQTVGASGAVYGLMGATFIAMRSRGIDPFATAIGPLLVINLIMTFVIPGISIAGHLGGLAAGAGAGWVMFEIGDRVRQGTLVTTALCAAGAVGLYLACLQLPDAGPLLPSPM